MNTRSTRSQLLIAALAFLLTAHVGAQVPPGWCVVGGIRVGPPFPAVQGDGGLFLVNPHAPNTVVPITGLPSSVTGCQWPAATLAGSTLVLMGATNDKVITTGVNWVDSPSTQSPAYLHILTLANTTVSSVTTYNLGTRTCSSVSNVPEGALLPDGRILLALDDIGLSPEPLAEFVLGIVDPTIPPGQPGSLTGFPVTWPPGQELIDPVHFVVGLALDPTGTVAYLGVDRFNDVINACISHVGSPNKSEIWSVPLTGPLAGQATEVATILGIAVYGLAVDASGQILATSILNTSGPSSTCLWRINPVSGAVMAIPSSIGYMTGITVEPETGDYLVLRDGVNQTPNVSRVYRMTPSGTATLLASGPPSSYAQPCGTFTSGWGELWGIAVAPSLVPYGQPTTPGSNSYSWLINPNPGGAPTIGNTGFSLTVATIGAAVPGIWLMGVAPQVPPVLAPGVGVWINVDFSQTWISGPLAGQIQEAVPLPIPNAPSLSGMPFYFQTGHAEPGGQIGATTGLAMTIL